MCPSLPYTSVLCLSCQFPTSHEPTPEQFSVTRGKHIIGHSTLPGNPDAFPNVFILLPFKKSILNFSPLIKTILASSTFTFQLKVSLVISPRKQKQSKKKQLSHSHHQAYQPNNTCIHIYCASNCYTRHIFLLGPWIPIFSAILKDFVPTFLPTFSTL